MNPTEIHLRLNEYNDLFSDFDPRPYGIRGLSDDFLKELRKAVEDAGDNKISIAFSVPKSMHNPNDESVIMQRLHGHFIKHSTQMEAERNREIKSGSILIAIGLILMFGAAWFSLYSTDSFTLNFFRVVLEPSAWFISWFGADRIFMAERENRAKLKFYGRTRSVPIRFETY